MNSQEVEEFKKLYFRLQRKHSGEPREYTMTEIEKIAERAVEILEIHKPDPLVISAFKEVKEKSDYYHKNGGWKYSNNIEEVKAQAIRAFQELSDREPGIAL